MIDEPAQPEPWQDEPPRLEPERPEQERFDALVSEVLDDLPESWAPMLDNMAIVVEEEPLEDDLSASPEDDGELLGRYRGSPRSVQLLAGGLAGPAVVAPPEIALFQGPLERASADEVELRALVRETLIKEIGHVFGIGDQRGDEDDDLDDEYDEDDLDLEGEGGETAHEDDTRK